MDSGKKKTFSSRRRRFENYSEGIKGDMITAPARPFAWWGSFNPLDAIGRALTLFGLWCFSLITVSFKLDLLPCEDFLDRPFLMMARVFGETYPKRLLNDPGFAPSRSRWASQLGEILARIHQLPVTDKLSFLKEKPLERQIEQNEAVYRAAALSDSPVLELAFRWLKIHLPRTYPVCFIHADFRMGNIMFDTSLS